MHTNRIFKSDCFTCQSNSSIQPEHADLFRRLKRIPFVDVSGKAENEDRSIEKAFLSGVESMNFL